jgi:large repetitive protein
MAGSAATAATFHVNTAEDTVAVNPEISALDAAGNISLRSAVMAANARPGEDTIVLPPNTLFHLVLGPSDSGIGEIVDASGDLDITDDLVIVGNGATVNAGGIDRVFDIHSLGAASTVIVRIENLTVTGGAPKGAFASGGGINVRGAVSLILQNVIVTGNSTGEGEFAPNGGGIAVNGLVLPTRRASLVMHGSSVTGNKGGNGGGILLANAVGMIEGVTVSGNEASAYVGGGGLALLGVLSEVDVENTTISGNLLTYTSAGGGAVAFGGANVLLNHVTVAANASPAGGFGLAGTSPFRLRNTLVANNTGEVGPDVVGFFVSESHNLVRDPLGGIFTGNTTGNIFHVDPLLLPLADNGGPTLTHALQPASPAVDAAFPSTVLETDQRGFPRAMGNAPDIGAFELVAPYTPAYIGQALRIAAGFITATPPLVMLLDVYADGQVNLRDAVVLARKVAGLEANP